MSGSNPGTVHGTSQARREHLRALRRRAGDPAHSERDQKQLPLQSLKMGMWVDKAAAGAFFGVPGVREGSTLARIAPSGAEAAGWSDPRSDQGKFRKSEHPRSRRELKKF